MTNQGSRQMTQQDTFELEADQPEERKLDVIGSLFYVGSKGTKVLDQDAKYEYRSLTKTQRKAWINLVDMALPQIIEGQERVKSDESFGALQVKVSWKTFLARMGLTSSEANARFKEEIDALRHNDLSKIQMNGDEIVYYSAFSAIGGLEIDAKRDLFSFQIDRRLVSYISENPLKIFEIRAQLTDVLSDYATPLLIIGIDLLSDGATSAQTNYRHWKEWKALLNISEERYPEQKIFNRSVMKRSIEQINKRDDVDIELEYVRKPNSKRGENLYALRATAKQRLSKPALPQYVESDLIISKLVSASGGFTDIRTARNRYNKIVSAFGEQVAAEFIPIAVKLVEAKFIRASRSTVIRSGKSYRLKIFDSLLAELEKLESITQANVLIHDLYNELDLVLDENHEFELTYPGEPSVTDMEMISYQDFKDFKLEYVKNTSIYSHFVDGKDVLGLYKDESDFVSENIGEGLKKAILLFKKNRQQK